MCARDMDCYNVVSEAISPCAAVHILLKFCGGLGIFYVLDYDEVALLLR